MALPYSSATSGKNAMAETQKILQHFGASSFGVMENFEDGELIVQFQFQGHRVTAKANAKGYAAALLREQPYTHRMRCTKVQHEQKALKQGQIAVYSIIRDWIKGQVTAIQCGVLSFEGAFLGQIMLPSGKTILDTVVDGGMLQITNEAS